MSRRQAFMMAAAATALGAGSTGCDKNPPCLSPPRVCLSIAPDPCTDTRHVVFEGASVTLTEEAAQQLTVVAKQLVDRGMFATLEARVYDDGHAEAALELHAPRLDAVRAHLVQHGAEGRFEVAAVDPAQVPMTPEHWQSTTHIANPVPLSGLVLILC